jgi:hypothetical protein
MINTQDKGAMAFENFKLLMKAMNEPTSPFPAPCNLMLGQGYQMPVMCGATGGECHVPCQRGVKRVGGFVVQFPFPVDFGVKRASKAFVLSRAAKVNIRGVDTLEFIVLVEEMREYGFFEFPILAFPNEYKGKSKELVKVW